jgi:hypothetical protein
LQHCIPFINFYNFTSKEFTDNVLPFKRILPKELYKDLLKTFLNLSDPNSKPNNESIPHMIRETKLRAVDSKIITYQHAELILKWINRLEITDKLTTNYKFKLLFRGSRDGFTSGKLHEICDGEFHTVTIVKVNGSNEILGGYNPIEWKSYRFYGTTKDSFIFSFNNNYYILSRVMNERNAIINNFFHGPSFGKDDFIIWSMLNGNYCVKVSYEKPIRKTTNQFAIEECEVFKLY